MIMAALAFNPVMNIIALPFALVVSVIAATTVFRNVFTLYDAFSSDSGLPVTSSGRAESNGPLRFGAAGARVDFAHNSGHHHSSNDIPLNAYKSHDAGTISVHRVVDIDVDGTPVYSVGTISSRRTLCIKSLDLPEKPRP